MRRIERYPGAVVARAYARSAAGLGATILPLLVLEPAFWLSAVLWFGAALFLVYLARSVALHTTRVVLDEDGIRTEGLFGVSVPWDALRAVSLNYYTTHSDRSQGWIELVVRGPDGTIRLESSLEGFTQIAACVAREALRRDCTLDERTRTHLEVLGIVPARATGHSLHPLTRAHHA